MVVHYDCTWWMIQLVSEFATQFLRSQLFLWLLFGRFLALSIWNTYFRELVTNCALIDAEFLADARLTGSCAIISRSLQLCLLWRCPGCRSLCFLSLAVLLSIPFLAKCSTTIKILTPLRRASRSCKFKRIFKCFIIMIILDE